MDTHQDVHTTPLLTLPVELIREIGDYLEKPSQLLNFSSVCKYVHFAFDMKDMFKKDAENQLIPTIFPMPGAFHTIFGPSSILGTDFLTLKRTTQEPISIHRPSLLWAIESGKDLEVIQQCINVYEESFPDLLEGKWYPYRDPLDSQLISLEFPSPIYAATKAGRLDVVQALVGRGVGVRGRYNDMIVLGGALAFLRSTNLQNHITADFTKENNAFKAACEAKREDIALFLISNGLDVQPVDLYCAVRFGCFQVLEVLLGHASLNGPNRQNMIQTILNMAATYPVADSGVFEPLFDAVTNPLFDRIEWLRAATAEALRRHIRNTPYFTSEDVPPGIYLFDLYVTLANPPFVDDDIARGAAHSDRFIEIVRTVISGHPWTIGGSEAERMQFMGDMLTTAVQSGAVNIAQYLTSVGCTYTIAHLQDAISAGNRNGLQDMLYDPMPDDLRNHYKLIDAIIRSGVSVFSRMKHATYKTPLQLALSLRDRTNMPWYATAFRLIYHGADYTDIPKSQKYQFSHDLRFVTGLNKYLSERSSLGQERTPSRLTFAKPVIFTRHEGRYDLECLDQTHALARLILGNNYWKQLLELGSLNPDDA
ncbi:hypothetical protein F4804DRAFT_353591 [Jackrogersella minutella]|nr:hypothetical protein F4804DRAFT_353591 [Jackrogersella minutella]